MPEYTVDLVRYFTADLTPTPEDPGLARRQQTYLVALEARGRVEVHKGQFRRRKKSGPMVGDDGPDGEVVPIRTCEEKGTDVNLGAHLVADGFQQRYEVAVVLSNDSDLNEPVRIVREEIGLTVGVLLSIRRVSRAQIPADFVKNIPTKALAASQLPNPVLDRDGRPIRKPKAWEEP